MFGNLIAKLLLVNGVQWHNQNKAQKAHEEEERKKAEEKRKAEEKVRQAKLDRSTARWKSSTDTFHMLLDSGLERFLRSDFLGIETAIKYPSSNSHEAFFTKAYQLMNDILDYYQISKTVKLDLQYFDEDDKNIADKIKYVNSGNIITIYCGKKYTYDNVATILCRECTNIFLREHNIAIDNYDDLIAATAFLGFKTFIKEISSKYWFLSKDAQIACWVNTPDPDIYQKNFYNICLGENYDDTVDTLQEIEVDCIDSLKAKKKESAIEKSKYILIQELEKAEELNSIMKSIDFKNLNINKPEAIAAVRKILADFSSLEVDDEIKKAKTIIKESLSEKTIIAITEQLAQINNTLSKWVKMFRVKK